MEEPEVMKEKKHQCAFCGKTVSGEQALIAGLPPGDLFICDTCVKVYVTVLLQEFPSDWHRRLLQLIIKPEKARTVSSEKKKRKA